MRQPTSNNKSFECLELIGWQHATDLLPSVVGQMVAARGADESTEWRQPVDLVALCRNASADLAAAFAAGRDRSPWLEHTRLAQNPNGRHDECEQQPWLANQADSVA